LVATCTKDELLTAFKTVKSKIEKEDKGMTESVDYDYDDGMYHFDWGIRNPDENDEELDDEDMNEEIRRGIIKSINEESNHPLKDVMNGDPVIVGEYNELMYSILKMYPGGRTEMIYQAGNSPLDSQIYLSADKGVGLEKMKEYCINTANETAEEEGLKYSHCEYVEHK
jgi:hypothetical protein